MNFAIFLKSSPLFNSFYLSFLFIKKTLRLNNLKSEAAVNIEISVFVISVETVINLHGYTFQLLKTPTKLPKFWFYIIKALQDKRCKGKNSALLCL